MVGKLKHNKENLMMKQWWTGGTQGMNNGSAYG